MIRQLIFGARQIKFRLEDRLLPARPWDGRHDPSLTAFDPWEGRSDGRFVRDFLGCRHDARFRVQYEPDPAGTVRIDYPRPTYEYFEWIALLEAVGAAPPDRPFVRGELGGGYGPWLVRAATALRRLGRPVPRLIGVEAEPQRSAWMAEHFRNNGLDPSAHRLLHAAMGPLDGSVWIRTDTCSEASYGLAVNDAGEGVRVPAVSLATLLADEPRVDLLHVDLQGSEGDVLESGESTLLDKVGRIIVATHSRRLHRRVRRVLQRLDWTTRFDFGFRSRPTTAFGTVRFLDGLIVADRPGTTPALRSS